MRVLLFISLIMLSFGLSAQYAPAAGIEGSTAIYKDSCSITNWAKSCNLQLGWVNIADTTLGKANYGVAANSLGKANNSTVSLGDGGIATLQFSKPITNGPSWDFVVFENSFNDVFLELAFVEISSDGENFFRFPAHSLTPTDLQISSFGTLNATDINNLAGKYRGGYGTPFDLSEIPSNVLLNIQKITHIRIIDVVGSIDTNYATRDTANNIINDPFPTPFPSSGFDLDAVGIIHQFVGFENITKTRSPIEIYPNPATEHININCQSTGNIAVFNSLGLLILETSSKIGTNSLDISELKSGLYIITFENKAERVVRRFIKK